MKFQGQKLRPKSGRVFLILLLSAVPGILGVPAWAGAPVSDAFNATSLNTSLWTFVNPVGDGSYSLSGTNLLLSVPAGVNHDVWATGNNGARIMQSITNVDFEVAVKMDTPVTAGSQMEGIIVGQSATQFLRFDLRHDASTPRLFAASISGATGTFRIDFALPGVTAPFWLKVNRTGNTWTESYSTDGTNYTTGGSFSYTLSVTNIGLFAGNYGNPASAAPAFTASFDYFLNTAAGTVPDLTVSKTHSGAFVQSGTGSYSVTVSNVGGAPTTQAVSITDTLPAGLTPTTASGTGWTCGISSQTVSCNRSDALAVASSYPPLAIAVSISATAPSSVTNTVTVAGGGETNTANDSASDPTTIQPAGQPPVISNISAAVTSASATITWTTDITSTSQVDYGTTTGYGSTVSNLTLVTSHSLNLTGLSCATPYQYKVTSISSIGFSASSSNQIFTTAACSTSGVPVSDNFDATSLNTSLWTFVNPVGNGILTLNGSEVQLTVPQGTDHDVWTAGNRSARIMQTMPNVDFEVVVRFNSIPMFGVQTQGLIVEQDSNNYIRFDSHHDGTSLRLFCASFAGGNPTARLNTPVVSSSFGPPFWLRVKRTGNTWTQSYSTDGVTYTVGITFNLTLSVARIGPFAGNAITGTNLPAFTASMDYFFNTASPIANNDGPLPFDRFVIDPNPPTTTLLKTFADIDGDGHLDAVIGFGNAPGASTGQGLAWYQYPHSGNLADHWNRHTILASGLMYEDSAAYDVNQDGAIDIIASLAGGQIYWFENPRGHGGNPATDPWVQHYIGTGIPENNMLLADIDGDGKMDLVTNGFIFFQNSPTSWTPKSYNRSSIGVALFDMGSGKGSINMVGMANFSPYPFVWLENPREHGGNARTDAWIAHVIGNGYDNTGTVGPSYAAADLNGDGRMDVVTARSEADPPAAIGALWWWEAPADRRNGTWIKHVIDPTYTAAHRISLGDMDGNGTTDIVISEQEQAPQRRVSIFYNDGLGHFSQRILSNGSGHNQTLADAEGDGDLDILNSGHGYFGAPHPVELYRNRQTKH